MMTNDANHGDSAATFDDDPRDLSALYRDASRVTNDRDFLGATIDGALFGVDSKGDDVGAGRVADANDALSRLLEERAALAAMHREPSLALDEGPHDKFAPGRLAAMFCGLARSGGRSRLDLPRAHAED